MKPLFMKLKAFGPFAKTAEISFETVFDGGLFLIHGRTGAGKTSLLDGLCYALFARPSAAEREKDLRALRSDLADDETLTEVELVFSIGSTFYRVHRIPTQMTPKKKGEGKTELKGSAELWRLDGPSSAIRGQQDIQALNWVPLAAKVEAVNETIEGLLGMNETQFRQVVVLPQGRFREFLSSSSTDRQDILEKLFQTGRFSRFQDFIREKSFSLERDWKQSVQEIQVKLEHLGLESQEEIPTKQSELATRKTEISEALQLAKSKSSELTTALHHAEEFERLSERKNKLAQEQSSLSGETASIQELSIRIKRAEVLAPYFQWQDRAVETNRKVEDLRKQMAQTETAFRQAETAFQSALQEKQRLESLKPSLEEMTAERDRLRKLVEGLRELSGKKAELTAEQEKISALSQQIQSHETSLASSELDKVTSLRKLVALNAAQSEKEASLLLTRTRDVQALELRFHQGEAARLATLLKKGEPCPVCGSLDHPAPVSGSGSGSGSGSDKAPGEKEVELARRELDLFKTKLTSEQASRRTYLETALDSLTVETSTVSLSPTDSWAGLLSLYERAKKQALEHERSCETLRTELKSRREFAQKLGDDIAKREALFSPDELHVEDLIKQGVAIKQSQEKRQIDLKTAQDRLLSSEASRSKNDGVLKAQGEELERYLKESISIQESLAKSLKAAVETEPALAQSPDSHRIASGELTQFKSTVERHNSLTTKNKASLAEVEDSLSELRNKTLRNQTEYLDKSSSTLRDLLNEAESRRSQTEHEFAEINLRLAAIEKLAHEIKESGSHLSRLRTEADRAVKLSELLAGDRSRNKLNVPFARFVLQNRFDEVLVQANRRLGGMSRGQFQLRRPALSRNLKQAQGLNITVEDSITGKERHADSLSGGESFMAALSLALGLADVVQSDLGGIRLDSVFIDEGFGTLDSESLDLAMRTLIDLQAGGRMVGIISHVQELRSQIHNKLEITKSAMGSSVSWN